MSKITVQNLSFGYDGSYENVFENVSFNIDTDWKLGLIGRNGKGKTTFLKLLQGIYKYQGTIQKSVEMLYFPFDVSNKNKMAIEIVNKITPNAEDWEIIKEINLMNTNPEILYRNFDVLSGGEQVKVLLASLFLRENSFLLRTVEVKDNQKLIDTGLYSIVRHPMYTVTIFLFLSIPLILGSIISFFIFLIYPFIIIKRINNEEKVLGRDLKEYKEYQKKVKYKLIPFIW